MKSFAFATLRSGEAKALAGQVRAGLCELCVHARVIENRRGSRFWLCELARSDARFPRYPPLPVIRCAGFSPNPAGGPEPHEES